MTTSKLWALIEEWRDAQLFPVSQAALASKIGVSRSAMSQWKAGQAKPSPEKLRQIASVTRIPYERLLEAVVHDMGYLGNEEVVGNAEHPAPIKTAGHEPAHDRYTLDGERIDPDDHVLAARDDDADDEAEAQQEEA
ncbi:hypothetical protein GCM10009718_32810 [Isoptericola halotolerans]|uniref:Transcriptional regulator with XRE-family HTH domain n=1 Tax=Isoptericola halotolerans TaxID=300560 RepID=A0ABX2A695_9MICO|nr:transcriptional regulator with XRE-family HTH domain [Isoptericola halotolerans]